MKRITVAVACAFALAVIAATIGSVQPARADTPGCVTRKEFKRVSIGMLKRRVHRIFDTSGIRVSWYYDSKGRFWERRIYDECKGVGEVIIDYKSRHVFQKAW